MSYQLYIPWKQIDVFCCTKILVPFECLFQDKVECFSWSQCPSGHGEQTLHGFSCQGYALMSSMRREDISHWEQPSGVAFPQSTKHQLGIYIYLSIEVSHTATRGDATGCKHPMACLVGVSSLRRLCGEERTTSSSLARLRWGGV